MVSAKVLNAEENLDKNWGICPGVGSPCQREIGCDKEDLGVRAFADDGGDEIQYLQEDQFRLIKEAEVHPLKGQSHYLQKEQHDGVHAIDLNIPACEGQQEESHEGNVSLTFFTKTKCTV